jgi:hypothetical protein
MKMEVSKIYEENGQFSKFVSLKPKLAIICINLLKTETTFKSLFN